MVTPCLLLVIALRFVALRKTPKKLKKYYDHDCRVTKIAVTSSLIWIFFYHDGSKVNKPMKNW